MDKKNTILLTVIAVATLLVAVVGATFAYFSVTNGTGTTNTTVTAQTPASNSTIVVTEGATKLNLVLSAEDMTQAKQGAIYYAVTDNSKKDQEIPSGSIYKTTTGTADTQANLGSVKLQNPVEGAKYSCNFAVSFTDEGEDHLSELSDHSSDIIFKLHGTGVGGVSKDEIDVPLDNLGNSIKFDVDLTNEIAKGAYYAEFAIKNTEDKQEGYLAGKTYSVKITTTITCAEKVED